MNKSFALGCFVGLSVLCFVRQTIMSNGWTGNITVSKRHFRHFSSILDRETSAPYLEFGYIFRLSCKCSFSFPRKCAYKCHYRISKKSLNNYLIGAMLISPESHIRNSVNSCTHPDLNGSDHSGFAMNLFVINIMKETPCTQKWLVGRSLDLIFVRHICLHVCLCTHFRTALPLRLFNALQTYTHQHTSVELIEATA